MLTRENAIASIIAADPTQNFPVMASSDVELLISQIYNEHELQMKAKEEEIERLKEDVELIKNIANGAIKGAIISHNIANAKARSIVAMLFWEAKRKKRHFEGQGWYEKGIVSGLKLAFEEAHSMLKDNQ